MPMFQDLRFPSSDQRLQLYAREYPGSGPTILMMHGLTRNSADFEYLAEKLAGRYRIIVPEQRGRGNSDRDPDATNYNPATYCADMLALIDRLKLDQPMLIGTSMGGLMAMIMASLRPGAFRAMVLNDVGPVVEQAGIERIASYVGAGTPICDWDDAAAYCRRTNGHAFPEYDNRQWNAFARRLFRENHAGKPELAYDPAIAAGLSSPQPSAVPPDLWPMWYGLAAIPVLVLRGELSDILSDETVKEMARTHPGMRALTVSRVGHAPMLDEPEALSAIKKFIDQHSKEVVQA
jgi:pimeloyl-ACP methyl ester carboxylesterase